MAKFGYWINESEKALRITNSSGQEIEVKQTEIKELIQSLSNISDKFASIKPSRKKSMSKVRQRKKAKALDT